MSRSCVSILLIACLWLLTPCLYAKSPDTAPGGSILPTEQDPLIRILQLSGGKAQTELIRVNRLSIGDAQPNFHSRVFNQLEFEHILTLLLKGELPWTDEPLKIPARSPLHP